MDNKALAETYVELYISVCDSYEKRIGNQPTTEEANMIFEQTCKRIISDLIGKQRSGVPTQESFHSDEKPSEKQVKYAKDLGCTFADTLTRAQISKWIEEHK